MGDPKQGCFYTLLTIFTLNKQYFFKELDTIYPRETLNFDEHENPASS